MIRPLPIVIIAIIFLFVGVASASAFFAFLPDPGSSPSIYDDFNWSSTANGYWHQNAYGATARIENSLLTLTGDSIELDRRVQTDPYETVIIAKVRGIQFHKFSLGIGIYHAGTVGLEFDNDGVKCGRGTDQGWQIDIMKAWTKPPVNQWFYVAVDVKNPYPNPATMPQNETDIKPVTLRCSMWDSAGHLVATDIASNPVPNTHYVALDEAYMRTWDSGNLYQIDWFYAGPPSGNPGRRFLQRPA